MRHALGVRDTEGSLDSGINVPSRTRWPECDIEGGARIPTRDTGSGSHIFRSEAIGAPRTAHDQLLRAVFNSAWMDLRPLLTLIYAPRETHGRSTGSNPTRTAHAGPTSSG